MKIIIASVNPQKVAAVKELIKDYDMFAGFEAENKTADSGVGEQPINLDQVIQGAMNRAKNVFESGTDYSFGIESGIMPVPHTKTGYMDVCACAIYDGKEFHLGLSSAFEPPRAIVKLIVEKGMNMSDASKLSGITNSEYLGYAEGLIGILTNNRLNRLGYTKQAVMGALIHLENTHLFKE